MQQGCIGRQSLRRATSYAVAATRRYSTMPRISVADRSSKEGLMSDMRSPHRFAARTVALVFSAAAFVSPAMAADGGASIPNLSGQWGRDMLFFEPAPSGPGPVVNAVRKADGTVTARDACCTIVTGWLGDHTNPILKPDAAAAVKTFGDLVVNGTVAQDLHNSCWPEPPPYVMGLHFGVQIFQQRDEVTLFYLLYNTVRHVRLIASHPENLAASWQGHSVGHY